MAWVRPQQGALIAGLPLVGVGAVRLSARVAAQGNIADFNAAPLVVDGRTLTAGDQVLVYQQTDPTENALYEVVTPGTGADGVWQLANDFLDAIDNEQSISVQVQDGDVDANHLFLMTTAYPITIGTTAINFQRVQTPSIDRLGVSVEPGAPSIVDIDLGTCRDESDTVDITLAAPTTVDITLVGAGGLDAGAEAADTWYYIFVIADTTAVNPPAGLASTSVGSPTLPAGYDVFRRVGVVRNDASSDLIPVDTEVATRFRRYTYSDDLTGKQVLSLGGATTVTAIDCSAFVPPTSRTAGIDARQQGNATAQLYGDPADAAADFLHELQGAQFGAWSSFPTDSLQRIAYRNVGNPRRVDVFVTGFSEIV